jgi:hypothetical protein
MTKQTSKLIAFTILAGLIVAVSGCKSICCANKKAGFATITCQPVNIDVTDKNQAVNFSVTAVGCGLNYRWYRNDQPLEEEDMKKGLVKGIFTSELDVAGAWRTETASYRCEIGSKNCQDDEFRTATRTAYLTYAPSAHAMGLTTKTPTVNLPPPGAPQNYSGFTYCSVAGPFRQIAPPPTNPAPTKCYVTLKEIDQPNPPYTTNVVVTSDYAIKVLDGVNHLVPSQNEAGNNQRKWFALSKSPYVITVYFTCASHPATAKLFLELTWEQ